MNPASSLRLDNLTPMLVMVFSVLLFYSNPSFAYCIPPSMYEDMPNAPASFGRPSVPYCFTDYKFSGRHTCSQWELDSYIDLINRYIKELNNYARQAQNFASSAIDFANQAARYAECEARAVKSEIE